MVVDEQLWNEKEIISGLTSFKWLMETEFGRKTRLRLESVSLAGVSTYKDL